MCVFRVFGGYFFISMSICVYNSVVKLPSMNSSNFKLIAFDLDGTLLNSKKQISAYTKDVLNQLRFKGIQTTIATGRILPAVRDYAEELEIDIPLIMSNGSILQTRHGKLATQTCLPRNVVETVLQISKNEVCDLVLYICDMIYFSKITENLRPTYGDASRQGMKVLDSWDAISDQLSDVNKCVFTHIDDVQLIRLQAELKQALDGSATTLRSSPVLLEVQPNGVTKAEGLHSLADMLGIQMEQTMAFGDYDNDAEMLAAAGLGIAVGEATPACIANADLVVSSSDNDGPAHFLEEFFSV